MIRHYYYTRFIQFICLNSIISLSYLGISRGDQPYPEVTLKDGSKITIGTYSFSADFIEVDGLSEQNPIDLGSENLIEIKLATLDPQKKLFEFKVRRAATGVQIRRPRMAPYSTNRVL